MSFTEQLAVGQYGEDAISRWFISKGYQVLPAYQVELNTGKGPRLFGEFGQLICPDLLVFNASKVLWIEAKTKSAFTWHRISKSWQTGIDKRHWEDYLRVAQFTPFDVWILFYHRNGCAKDTPLGMQSPCGLYGQEIKTLNKSMDHESDKLGSCGMVYWRESSLRKLQ